MPSHIDLPGLWQHHRNQLHNIDSWSTLNHEHPVSLTYAPSGCGATTISMLGRLFFLFPASEHLLDAVEIKRFNNQVQSVSVNCDYSTATVVEEILVSAVHCRRMDYLLPAVEATNKTFTTAMVIVAQYSKSDGKLYRVNLYWDQASIMRQLDVIPMAFHNVMAVLGNGGAPVLNALDNLPIADGMRVARRILNPTSHNANILLSLDTLEAHRHINSQNGSVRKLAPIGGLDNISELAYQLPAVAREAPVMRQAQQSTVFDAHPETIYEASTRKTPALTSKLDLCDGSEDKPQPRTQNQKQRSIFSEESAADKVFTPVFAMDAHRNTSSVFTGNGDAFRPGVSMTDTSRFDSRIFTDSSVDERQQRAVHPQFQSSIGVEDISVPVVKTVKNTPSECPFSRGDDYTRQQVSNMQKQSSAPFGTISDDVSTSHSFSGRRGDPNTNRSSIFDEVPRCDAPTVSTRRWESHLVLGDAPTGDSQAFTPSTRVLQPPGGKSNILFDEI